MLYSELAEVAPNGVIRPQVFVKARSMDRCIYAYDICTMQNEQRMRKYGDA